MLRLVLRNLLLAGLYFVSGYAGYSLGFSHQNVAPFWPPSGLSLVALWFGGPWLLPGVFAGSFFNSITLDSSFGAAMFAGAAGAIEAWAGYVFLKRLRFDHTLGQIRDVFLLLVVAFLAPALGASVGVFGRWFYELVAPGTVFDVWLVWWGGDVVGLFLFAPFLFAWSKPKLSYPLWRFVEIPLIMLGLVFVSNLVFTIPQGMWYAVFPFLIWAALRFYQPGATLAIMVLSILTISLTITGQGPFAFAPLEESFIRVQFFLGVASTTVYVLAAGAAERERNVAIMLKSAALEAANAEAEASRYRFAFLAEVSRVLSESIDYETTLRNIVRLAIPHLADQAVATEVHDDGTLRYIEVYHPHASRQAKPREEKERIQKVGPEHPIFRAVRTRSIILSRESEPEGSGEEHLIVPLESHGGIALVVCLTLNERGRHYTKDDIALAEEVRARANMAVENASLYQKAQQAIQLRNQFLSIAAHELKTPVTGILGFAQFASRLVERSPRDEEQIFKALNTIEVQARKLSSLITQLLDIARIQSGKLQPSLQAVEVRALVNSILAQMQGELAEHAITVNGPEVTLQADPIRLEQVLVNLLANAAKFTPPGSPIEIEIASAGGVRIAVRDHGPGIPLEDQPFVFDRFFQGQKTAQGMGLGLYISREIVETHGGKISVETPPDGGARFVLFFPAAA